MLQSLLEQKRAPCAYGPDSALPTMFTGSQWKLVELLTPYEELTQRISPSTASAADVFPLIRALTRLLERTADTDHEIKTTFLGAVQKKFHDFESEHIIASLSYTYSIYI